MPAIINFKICDNSEDCNGISVCPTKAIYFDKNKKSIVIDDDKCTSCGICVESCPVSAIFVGKTKQEFEKIKKDISNDPRKISDLFVDRYGAQPIDDAFFIISDKFDVQILKSTKLAVAEIFDKKSIMCLKCSIPISELFKDIDVKYRKVFDDARIISKKYSVKKRPCLLFFKDSKLIGKIEGYYEVKDRNKLIEKIKMILQ
jgi:NAD-dependent dihydropyrimidine dehydrogenase PreA subunit